MLRKLKLKNFRTHKKTRLKFCSGINGIIGISSSGKTNILRAIKLLHTNRPLGNGVINRNAKTKEAVIESDWTGVGTIKMVKGKDSYYQINKQKPFRKIGTNVPQPVSDALFLSDLNVLAQYDGPFLIFSGPGEISKAINESTGSGEFDIWISNINNRIKDVKFAAKDAGYRVEKYRLEKEKLRGIESVAREVKKLSKLSKHLKELRYDCDEITELYNRLIGFQSKVVMHKKIISLEKYLKRAKKLREQIEVLEVDVDLADDLVNRKMAMEELVKRHNDLVERYSKVLKKERKCPTCFSPIKQSTIKRLNNAIRLDF